MVFNIKDIRVTLSGSPIGFRINDDTRIWLEKYLRIDTSNYFFIAFDKFISYNEFEKIIITTSRNNKLNKI